MDCRLLRCCGCPRDERGPAIISNGDIFNTRTYADGTWRRNTILVRGDDFQVAMGSNSVKRYPADRELPQTH